MTICDNCELAYDETSYRFLCPNCGWKASCCEGAPADIETAEPAPKERTP